MNQSLHTVKSQPALRKTPATLPTEANSKDSIDIPFGPAHHRDGRSGTRPNDPQSVTDDASRVVIAAADDAQPVTELELKSVPPAAREMPSKHAFVRIIYVLLGGLLVGATTAIYSISFVAIIYDGALAPFLGWGIGIGLVGAAIMAAGSGWLFSITGTISHPQDITAVMLATAVPHLAAGGALAGEDLFITAAAMIALTGIAAGIFALIVSCCKPSRLLRFFPYPVMGGFLAATGYFLVVSAIAMLLGRNITLQDLGGIWSTNDMLRWVPWIGIGLIYAILARVLHGAHKLPIAILTSLAGFYAITLLTPGGMEGARAAGALLGPFPSDGLLDGYDPALVSQIDWGRIQAEIPVIAGVAGMVAIGGWLNLNGLHHVTQKPLNLDRDLRSIGALNAVSSFAGGLPGYPAISTTFLGLRLGLPGAVAALGACGVCAGLAVFGTGVLAVLPVGMFAAIVAFLGFDLIYAWLWLEARKVDRWSKVLMFVVIFCALTIGVLQALAVGVLASLAARLVFR